jgi:hypothetical protein
MTSYTQTITSNVRGQYNTTFTSTYHTTRSYNETWYTGCTGQYGCYDSTAASSCRGSCSSTALMCTDWWEPYCASLYVSENFTRGGIAYFCDTAAYGLEYGDLGQWPSWTSSYVTTLHQTYTGTTPPSWTAEPVPFTVTQNSRPASAATLPVATQTSGAVHNYRTEQYLFELCLCTLLWVTVASS